MLVDLAVEAGRAGLRSETLHAGLLAGPAAHLPRAGRRHVQGDPFGQAVDRHRHDRALRCHRHPAEERQAPRRRHHHHRDRPRSADARRREVRGRQSADRAEQADHVQGLHVLEHAEHDLLHRLLQRVVDAEGRSGRRLRLPPAEAHGRHRREAGDAGCDQRGVRQARPPQPLHLRLHQARRRQGAAHGRGFPVVHRAELLLGPQDAAARQGRRRHAGVLRTEADRAAAAAARRGSPARGGRVVMPATALKVREPTTHVERREEAERKLLAAAAKIIAVKGLERFTLAEVGETAGYSRGLPRHYFGDKDELTIRVALYVAEHPILQERLQVEPGLETVISMIRFFFAVAPKYRTNVRALSIVLAGVLTSDSLKEPIARMTRAKRAALAEHIAIGIKQRRDPQGREPRSAGDPDPVADARRRHAMAERRGGGRPEGGRSRVHRHAAARTGGLSPGGAVRTSQVPGHDRLEHRALDDRQHGHLIQSDLSRGLCRDRRILLQVTADPRDPGEPRAADRAFTLAYLA